MALSSFSVSSVRSETSSAAVSKLTMAALSWCARMTPSTNLVAASCWKRKRSRMLLLVSIRMFRIIGKVGDELRRGVEADDGGLILVRANDAVDKPGGGLIRAH